MGLSRALFRAKDASAENVSDLTKSLWLWEVLSITRRVSVFHAWTDLYSEQEMMRLPSGENATDKTDLLWLWGSIEYLPADRLLKK